MKSTLRKNSCLFLILTFGLTLLPIDTAIARGGGRGGGGGARGGGGGASARMSGGGASRSGGGMQNRGSFDSGSRSQSRSAGQGDRQAASQGRQGDRQSNQQNRQSTSQNRQDDRQGSQQNRQNEMTQRTDSRQQGASDRTDTRQQGASDRQNNRQNFVNNNNNNWYGGGWNGRGYAVPAGWGLVGLTTGLVLGSAIATPPPYYETVYVGSSAYMYSDGVYLQPSGDEYMVVAPPLGATVAYLPDGCTSQVSNGVSYFNCSGVYYQPYFQNGTAVYQVVRIN
ncbi:MAG: DUF6515 family protein [Microcystaceae cyanobacterium]